MQKTSKHDFTEQEIEDLLSYYKDHTGRQTAHRFNTNYSTVWRLAHERGQRKPKHDQTGFQPLEHKLKKMTGRRFVLNGLGWTVTVQGYELSDSEVRVLTDKAKPRTYKRKGALTRLDEDFLRMER